MVNANQKKRFRRIGGVMVVKVVAMAGHVVVLSVCGGEAALLSGWQPP